MACIRQVNLDAFWSRATGTVETNTRLGKNSLKLSQLVGLEGFMRHDGKLPAFGQYGYEVAINILLASRRPRRHSSSILLATALMDSTICLRSSVLCGILIGI